MITAKLRLEIIQRDDNICQICFTTDKRLDVHHVIPVRLKGLDVLNNLVSVCRSCHRKIELFGKRFIDTSGPRKIVFTPCCNYEQVIYAGAKKIFHCTKCKKPFLDRKELEN